MVFTASPVNAKYLVAFKSWDDDFDTDFGYSGKVQYAVSFRDPNIADKSASNGFESDNDATGSVAKPRTMPVFSNITIVGPKGNGSVALPTGEKFEKAFRLRRNTATSVFNSIITGWESGLSIEGSSTEDNFTGDTANFMNNLLVNIPAGKNVITANYATFYAPWFNADGNDTTKTLANINWVSAFPVLGTKPDMRLQSGSAAATGASFPAKVFGGDFVSVKENNFNGMLSVYPNPCSSQLNILLNAALSEAILVTVSDISGRVAVSAMKTVEAGSNAISIETSSLNNGIYFVTLEGASGKETVKLMISK